jgi:hypothetical protein
VPGRCARRARFASRRRLLRGSTGPVAFATGPGPGPKNTFAFLRKQAQCQKSSKQKASFGINFGWDSLCGALRRTLTDLTRPHPNFLHLLWRHIENIPVHTHHHNLYIRYLRSAHSAAVSFAGLHAAQRCALFQLRVLASE